MNVTWLFSNISRHIKSVNLVSPFRSSVRECVDMKSTVGTVQLVPFMCYKTEYKSADNLLFLTRPRYQLFHGNDERKAIIIILNDMFGRV